MPFRFPFNSPFNFPFNTSSNFYSPSKGLKIANTSQRNVSNSMASIASKTIQNSISNYSTKKASEADNASEAFFEIFGLKIYFDDILIMCILFFLYTENVHNDELFICLILLLLS